MATVRGVRSVGSVAGGVVGAVVGGVVGEVVGEVPFRKGRMPKYLVSEVLVAFTAKGVLLRLAAPAVMGSATMAARVAPARRSFAPWPGFLFLFFKDLSVVGIGQTEGFSQTLANAYQRF